MCSEPGAARSEVCAPGRKVTGRNMGISTERRKDQRHAKLKISPWDRGRTRHPLATLWSVLPAPTARTVPVPATPTASPSSAQPPSGLDAPGSPPEAGDVFFRQQSAFAPSPVQPLLELLPPSPWRRARGCSCSPGPR